MVETALHYIYLSCVHTWLNSLGIRIATAVPVLVRSRGLLMSGAAMILNRVPEEAQFIEALRSIPNYKSFSISFAFPEPSQVWHTVVMDEFWQHLEETTGARVSFSAVDTCALCGPLTSIYSAHMMIIQKARDIEIKEFEAEQEAGNGLEHHEYTCPRSIRVFERGTKCTSRGGCGGDISRARQWHSVSPRQRHRWLSPPWPGHWQKSKQKAEDLARAIWLVGYWGAALVA